MNTLGIAVAVAIAALALTAKRTPKAQKVRVSVDKAARRPRADQSNR